MKPSLIKIRRVNVLLLTFQLFALLARAQTLVWSDLSKLIVAPTPNAIADVQFIGNEGWIPCTYTENAAWVSDFYHTTDGARTFEHWRLPYAIWEIHMVDRLRGYGGVSQSGRIYRTEDGGRTWTFIGSLGSTLLDLTFPPTGEVGYACGYNGRICRITSTNVTSMPTEISGSVYSICFPESESEGWAAAGPTTLYYTPATGWIDCESIDAYGPTWANAMFLFDNQHGWAFEAEQIWRYPGLVPEPGKPDYWNRVWLRPDAEVHWRAFHALHFSSLSEGWIAGNYSNLYGPYRGGLIWHTLDGGTTWMEGSPLSTTNMLTAVFAVDEQNVYVVGNNGTLFKYGVPASAALHLSIALDGTNVVLSWSAAATGFTLTAAAQLDASGTWSAVTNAPARLGTNQVVTNVVTGASQFYRLQTEP